MSLTRTIAIVKAELEVEAQRFYACLVNIRDQAELKTDVCLYDNVDLSELTQAVLNAIEYEGRVHMLRVLLNRLLKDEGIGCENGSKE